MCLFFLWQEKIALKIKFDSFIIKLSKAGYGKRIKISHPPYIVRTGLRCLVACLQVGET